MSNINNYIQSNISFLERDIGAHTCFNGSIHDCVNQSIELGMYSTQFFLGNPKGFNRHNASIEDITKTKRLIKRFPIHIFSHFPYISNLAGSKNICAWDGDSNQDAKTSHILKSLEYELSVLSNFTERSNGVVIHPGNHIDKQKGLKAIAKSINKINFTENSKLLLENSSGGGTSLATTFEEIKTIIDHVNEDKREHIGVCIDTAHTYGFGLYDLSKCSEVEKMFEDFDKIIGAERFSLLHLNDSMCSENKRHDAPFGSQKDSHECIGEGYIWRESLDSLKLLLDICNKRDIPIVLETHVSDLVRLSTI